MNAVETAWSGVIDVVAPRTAVPPVPAARRALPVWVARTGLMLGAAVTLGALITCTVLALLLIAGVSRGHVQPGTLLGLAAGSLLAAVVSLAGGAVVAILRRQVGATPHR